MSCSVVLVNSWRVVGAKGGTEKVFCDLANALNRRGFLVTMLFCDPRRGNPGFAVDNEVRLLNVGEVEGVVARTIRKIKAFSWKRGERKKKRSFLRINRFSSLFEKARDVFEHADVVISFQPETTFIIKEKLRIEVPVISMFHHNPSKYFDEPLFDPFFKRALLKCEALQVLRPEFSRELSDFDVGELVCIPNSCPLMRQQKELMSKKIVYTGRVNLKQKRVDLLVESFALLKDRFPDWCVEIWGELNLNAHDTEYVRALIEKLGLRNRVFLMGVTDNVESILMGSSIFAFPSAYEGFGLSLIEAMMVGLPSVGCVDCPAVNTLIKNNVNGFLVEPNPRSFADGLSALMADVDRRKLYGAEARKTARCYDPDAVWKLWESLIMRVVDKSKNSKDRG